MRPRCALLLCGCIWLGGCDDFTQVSASGFGAFEPSLAVVDGGLAVAWNDNRGGNDEIYLRLLADDLTPRSDELRLTDNPELSYEAALVAFAGKLAVAWYDRDVGGNLSVMLGLWNLDGSEWWSQRMSTNSRNQRIPVLQVVGERLFIAWVEDAAEPSANSTLYGAWLDAAGNWLQQPFAIAAASRTTWNLNAAALRDGRIALVYDAEIDTQASELYLALIGAQGAKVTRLSADDGFASKYPDIAVRGNTSALTWFDVKDGNEEVYLVALDPLAPVEVASSGRRITQTAGESIGAYLAWNGDTLGLAWNDNDVGQHEIYFQRFDQQLEALTAVRQLSDTDADSMIPAIVAHGTGFALAWNEVVLGAGGHDGGMSSTRSEIAVVTVD